MCEGRSSTRALPLTLESVADLPDRLHEPRIRRVMLDLSSQLGDVGVDGSRSDERAVTPDLLEQLVARRDGAVAPDESEEELVGFRRQRAGRAIPCDRARARVYDDVAEAQQRV